MSIPAVSMAMIAEQVTPDTFSQLFDTEMTIQYQNGQFLANTIEERHGTSGAATNVPLSDIIEMQPQGFAPSNIPVTPVDATNIIVVPYNYSVKTVVGGGQKTLYNFDLIVTQAKLHGRAAARWVDYIKINAIFADPNLADIYVVDADVGVNTGINQGKITEALSYLEDQSVPVSQRSTSCWIPAIAKQSLFNDPNITSILFDNTKPLATNSLSTYSDSDLRYLGSNGVNTIPFTTAGSPAIDTYLVPIVHNESMVQIFNRDPITSITWVPQEDRWEVLTVMTTGAKIVQYNGIALMTVQNPFSANA